MVLVAILAGASLTYSIKDYVVTCETFEYEQAAIYANIDQVEARSKNRDYATEYHILDIEERSVQQQMWEVEAVIDKNGSATPSQQNRLYQMNRQLEEIRKRKQEIQKIFKEGT